MNVSTDFRRTRAYARATYDAPVGGSSPNLPVLAPRDDDTRSDCATLWNSEKTSRKQASKRDSAAKSPRTVVGAGSALSAAAKSEPSVQNSPTLPRRTQQGVRPFYKPTLFVIFIERLIYLLANAFIVSAVIYIAVQFILAARHDLNAMASKYSTELRTKVANCSRQYIQNKCHPETRVRYMDEQCIAWEICMNEKHSEILYLKAMAEVASKTLNTFFDGLTYRSALLGVAFFMASLYVTIRGITMYRISVIREERAVEEHKSVFASREMSAAIAAAASSAIAARDNYHMQSGKQ